MIHSWSYGGTIARPRAAASASVRALRCSVVVPSKITSAPSARTPSTFTAGAVVGITTTAGMPSSFAASAIAMPWLPDEKVMTPRARTSSGNCSSMLAAPRILNAPLRWRFSHLSDSGRGGATSAMRVRDVDERSDAGKRPDARGRLADVFKGHEIRIAHVERIQNSEARRQKLCASASIPTRLPTS